MEAFVMNIGIVVLILGFTAATYFLPITISYVIAIVYLSKVGITGYYVVMGDVGPLVMIFAIVSLIIDVSLWQHVRSDPKARL